MRRGHPGRGGWRGDIPRHFRPRNGGGPLFRPSRGFPHLSHEPSRYPPRFPYGGPPPFNTATGPVQHEDNERSPYHSDPNKFKFINKLRSLRDQEKSLLKTPQHFNVPNEHYDNSSNNYHVNDMGDVDQRQVYLPVRHHPIPPWENAASRSYDLQHDSTHEGNSGKFQTEYSGHRPPASDHYEGKPGPDIDNSDSFSRSVDDTVDIIRRKLQTRNAPQFQTMVINQNHENIESSRETASDSYQQTVIPQEHTPRKKPPRQRPNIKTNCDKIKSNIVHQLFKMDKGRIHRLLDNPNSSHKFEYAINSLITESQNSFNRHLRSNAEKSLCGARNEIMQYNESDTIYEDTFMKQMQCILEPQDTVLLEDIKPIVMAELNKVLQLSELEYSHGSHDDVDYRLQNYQDHEIDIYQNQATFGSYTEEYASDCQDKSQYYLEAHSSSYNPPETNKLPYASSDHSDSQERLVDNQNDHSRKYESPLYERRTSRKSSDYERRRSAESRRRSSSFEKPLFDIHQSARKDISKPYFDANTEQLSEDEDDPFAELDKQYHVAVDHNFIEAEDPTLTDHSNTPQPASTDKVHRKIIKSPNPYKTSVKKELSQPNFGASDVDDKAILNALEQNIKTEMLQNIDDKSSTVDSSAKLSDAETVDMESVKKEKDHHFRERTDSHKSDLSTSSLDKSTTSSTYRKRSMDQRPPHRKEKRKKIDNSSESNKQILNKNIIINLNDCAAKTSETCEKSSGKSIFNLFFSKGDKASETPKDKNNENQNSGYPEKYVKRKESQPKQSKVIENKNNNSSTFSHSTSSSKDGKKSSITPTKSDSKSKLKTIDMFESQPKKSSSTHQLYRKEKQEDTIKSSNKIQEDKPIILKTLPLKSISKQVTKKHVSTQVLRKTHSKECQTDHSKNCIKTLAKGTQTDPMTSEKPPAKSTNAFERMKEIDMEIQVLLQEKFKLYNSLESKDTSPNIMPSLGMTVLNMDKPNEEETDLNVDSVVDDFTNIPEEELEQIALESVREQPLVPPLKIKIDKTSPRPKNQKKSKKVSTNSSMKKLNKSATPNISLLEQIITDERPLEEIISLDAFETSPIKTRNKRKQKKSVPKIVRPKENHQEQYNIKDCYVRLTRADFSRYFNLTKDNIQAEKEEPIIEEHDIETDKSDLIQPQDIDIPIVNDFHFQDDMLDVSEDIVIDSNCEFKLDDKDMVASESVIEEVVLDNSQRCDNDETTVESSDSRQETLCKMYDYSADEDLRQDSSTVTGNGDAVLAIECVENNFLAACLDGNVYHFNPDGQLLATLRGSNLAVTCLTIVHEKYGTTVYTGSLDSRIRYYDLETSVEKGPECNVLSPIQTMDRAWDTVFVGTRTGFVLQFECKNNMLIPVSTIKFSEQSILALRALKEGPRKVLLVAARSENVTIKDAQTGLLLRTLVGPKMTVYTLLYEDGKIYCGTSSNQIQLFDYASGTHIGKHDGGKGAVCLRAAGGLLFAGCYDGCVYVFRSGESSPFAQLRGPGVMLLSLAVVDSKIIAGYKDRSLYIWKIPFSILQEMVL